MYGITGKMKNVDIMTGFICPVCKKPLMKVNKSEKCENNHLYDVSKTGYINLLMSQKTKDKNHGDDKLMVKARRDFLDKGYYTILLNKISETVIQYCNENSVILDAGCGECFYTSNIYDTLCTAGIKTTMLAIDISKNALSLAKNRNPDINRSVASIFDIPVADSSCDIILNIFAPFCSAEFLRLLKVGSILIQVIPLENHLWSLKKIVYDDPYKNVVDVYRINGFEFVKSEDIKGSIELESNQDIKNLFTMTPYYYKTSQNDFNKLNNINYLKTEIEFAVLVYKKI